MMKKQIKKFAIAVAAAIMTLTATGVVSYANDGMGAENMNVSTQDMDQQMYVTAQSGANVRSAPSTDARIITSFDYNTQIHVTGKTSNGWYTFIVADPQTGGETGGYISASLLSTSKGPDLPAPAPTPTRPDGTPSYIKTGYNNNLSGNKTSFTVSVAPGSYLALRSDPSFSYSNEIAQLKNGETVELVNQRGGNGDGTYWCVIVPGRGNINGFVNSNYLK